LEDDVRTLAVLLMELIDDGELYDLCPVEVVVRRLKKLEFLRKDLTRRRIALLERPPTFLANGKRRTYEPQLFGKSSDCGSELDPPIPC